MAPPTNDQQFKFLISCIRWSNNGKVDFGEVAAECDIVSKGAAAKRYERMMKAHGIAPGTAASSKGPATPRSTKSEKSANQSSVKKRKIDAFMEDQDNRDDDEDGLLKVKPERTNSPAQVSVKKESYQHHNYGSGNDILQYTPSLHDSQQSFVSPASSMYEPIPDGFNTPDDEAYDMQAQAAFGGFALYGKESGADNISAPASQNEHLYQPSEEDSPNRVE